MLGLFVPMRLILALLFSFSVSAFSAAVSSGDALESVLAELGEPKSRLDRGNVTVLTYESMVVRLEDGVVVSQTKPSADYAVRSEPARASSQVRVGRHVSPAWGTDYESARIVASGSGRKILLFFTGSDWCGWCKRLEAEILATPEFLEFAGDNLVLVKLDFPRRIEQAAEVKAQNERLAREYRIRGYPTIVVLDDAGAALGRLGYQDGGPAPFIERIKQL